MIEGKVSWVREERLEGRYYIAQFIEVNRDNFTVTGLYPSRNLLSLGGGVTFQKMPDRLSLGLYYDSLIRDDYFNQALSLVLNFPF